MLRSDRWSYASYAYEGALLAGERELYDMGADPFQMVNVAGTAPASVTDELHEKLRRLAGCRGTACARL
jgi:hypothetical protein